MSLPLIAKRVEEIPFSGLRRVFQKATQLEKSGMRVIHFEIGKLDFDTPAHIKSAAARALDQGMVHYTPNVGIPQLREAVSDSIQKYKGVQYDPATEIIMTAGGQGASYLGLQATVNPGDEILVPNPGFGLFTTCTRLAGGVPVFLPLTEKKGFSPDIHAAEKLLTPKTRAIIVNSPHNPTGSVLTRDQMEAVCNFAKENDLFVLSDEAYDRLLYDGTDFLSPAALPDMKERTLIWGSLSKTYSMTGWRIGYLAAPKEVIEAAVKIQQNAMLSLCAFAQAGAVEALKGPQDCVEEMLTELDRRRCTILDAIAQSPSLSCPLKPLGAFYVFAKHEVPGMNSEKVSDYLLEQAGVAVAPGTVFGSGGEGYFRISYSISSDDCREGMDRIAQAMTKLQKSQQ
jgi:aspartate aminotransferase/aminotransferase